MKKRYILHLCSLIIFIIVPLYDVFSIETGIKEYNSVEYYYKNRVAVLGDSITEDGGFIKKLQVLRPDLIFHNYGISCETTTQILKRVRASNSDLKNKILGVNDYSQVIVFAGVNNIYNPKKVIVDLQKIYNLIKRYSNYSVKVIAVTLSPWGGYKTWTPQKQRYTEMVNRFILSKPTGVDKAVNIYDVLKDPQKPWQLCAEYHFPGDKLHPRGMGQEMIGLAIYKIAYLIN